MLTFRLITGYLVAVAMTLTGLGLVAFWFVGLV